MEKPIKVMIVDDHDMVRLGLRTYLLMEPELEVTAEAADGQQAAEYLKRCGKEERPDIVLMDLMMPVMDGVEATREIASHYPEVKIVILTSFLEDEKIVEAIEAGASCYILKTVSSDELVRVIRGVYQGLPMMTPEVSQALTRGLRERSAKSKDEGFTQREKEVLLLIAEGKSNKDIADELHISIKTVKTHVSNLLMKCELEDRTQLAIYVHRKGWI